MVRAEWSTDRGEMARPVKPLAQRGKKYERVRFERPRRGRDRRQWRDRVWHCSGARRTRLRGLGVGTQRRQELRGCRDAAQSRREGRCCRMRRERCRLGAGSDGANADDVRPGRWLLCQRRHRRRRPTFLYRPHRGTMAHDVCNQPRRSVSRLSGGRAAHDRTRGQAAMRSGGWSRRPASRRSSVLRATSITQRPRLRSTLSFVRSASSWHDTASPRTRSCQAGSEAT